MIRIRPYKDADEEAILSWCGDEETYYRWTAGVWGEYPVTKEQFKKSAELMRFTAMDEKEPAGFFTVRNPKDTLDELRFGFVIVDPAKRGKGVGREMMRLGLKYAFGIYRARRVSLGVFEDNTAARRCYSAAGFAETDAEEEYAIGAVKKRSLIMEARNPACGVVLRDMKESDIEDYVRWFTVCTDWMDTDAPWEPCGSSPEEERKAWTEYYESVRELPEDAVRRKFEIELDGKHAGWVSRYFDLEYMENPDRIPAVGIDIAEPSCRGMGAGTEALREFILYLKNRGFGSVYTQTWSGNKAMLRTAEKLGFAPVCVMPDLRTVNGKKYDAVTLKLDLR